MDYFFNRINTIDFTSTNQQRWSILKILLICAIGAAANAQQNKMAEVELFGSSWAATILSFLSPVIIELAGFYDLKRVDEVRAVVDKDPELECIKKVEDGLRQFPNPPRSVFFKPNAVYENDSDNDRPAANNIPEKNDVSKKYWPSAAYNKRPSVLVA